MTARIDAGAMLDPGAMDLIWYYTRGQCLCERSTMGPMLAAAEARSTGSRECARCNRPGPRVTDADGERVHLIDPSRDGGTPGILADGSWCPACKGTGWVECAARARRKAPTARPQGLEVRSHGVQADDRALHRAAQVSRWIWRVKRLDAHAAQALEAYYGNDSGTGEGTPWGPLLAVMAITPAGRKLVRVTRARRDEPRRPVERLRTLAQLSGLGEGADLRQALLVAAADQAAALLLDAMTMFRAARRVER